jgi:hypothetical protein
MAFNAHAIPRPLLLESLALAKGAEPVCQRSGGRERFLIFSTAVRRSSSVPSYNTTTRRNFSSPSNGGGCDGDASTSSSSHHHPHGSNEWKTANRQEILQEAAALSRSLYRTCFRSARYIRKGNAHDEQEFQQREEHSLETPLSLKRKGDARLGMLSMLPPVDREDELRSRSEYYLQYMRENFVAERDCLATNNNNNDDDVCLFDNRHFARYLYHLRKGNEHRMWLLHDMKFDHDPYSDRFDTKRVDRLEARATTFFKELQQIDNNGHLQLDTTDDELNVVDQDDDMLSDLDDDDDDSSDEDERPRSKNRRNRT